MNDDAAQRIHTLSQRVIDVVTEHNNGTVGEGLHSLAVATAWYAIHIGGPGGRKGLKGAFDAAFDDFISNLEDDALEAAEETHQSLKRAAGAA